MHPGPFPPIGGAPSHGLTPPAGTASVPAMPSRPIRSKPAVERGSPSHFLAALGLAFGLVTSCAPVPPREPLPTHPDLAWRFFEEDIACDDAGNVYVTSLERFQDQTRVFFVSSRDHGETWQSTFRYLDQAGAGTRAAPRLAVGGDREVHVVWEDDRRGPRDIVVTGSLDGGENWLPETRVNTTVGTSHAVAPAIACDRWGRVYVVWLDDREGFEAFYCNRSVDSGRSWQTQDVRVTPLRLGRKSAPRLRGDDSGRLFVSWIELRDGRQKVYFSASPDGGATWSFDDFEISSGSRAVGEDLASLDADILLQVWQEKDPSSAQIYLRRSEDRGRSWSTNPSRLWTREQPLFDPSVPILVEGDWRTVYILWTALAADGTARVILKASSDGARSFQENILTPMGSDFPLAPPSRSESPLRFDAAADRNGNLYLVWRGGSSQQNRIEFYRAAQAGANWIRNEVFVAPFGHEPRVPGTPRLCADDNGHVHLLWNEGHALHAASSALYGDSGWRHVHF